MARYKFCPHVLHLPRDLLGSIRRKLRCARGGFGRRSCFCIVIRNETTEGEREVERECIKIGFQRDRY